MYGYMSLAPAAFHEIFPNAGVPGTAEDWESSIRGIGLGNSIYLGKVKMSNLPSEIFRIITLVKPKPEPMDSNSYPYWY